MRPSRNQDTGRRGEDLAAAYLQSKGYAMLTRNYRSRRGELDLVCEKDGVIVFVEVKTRSSFNYGSGAEAVNRAKQARIRSLALEYLQDHPICRVDIRFDVISILWHDEQHHRIEHIEAAF